MKAMGILLGKSEMTGDSTRRRSLPISRRHAIGKRIAAWILACGCLVLATPAAMALDLSQYPLFIGSVTPANVLLILDDSNSMDEVPTGGAVCDLNANGTVKTSLDVNNNMDTQCGSRSDASKSQLARTAAKNLITSYTGKINLGLMAYQQDAQSLMYLYDSFYDASYDSTLYPGTKQFRTSNPSNPGHYIYYNVASPSYLNSAPANPNNPLDPLNFKYCYTGDNPVFPTTVGTRVFAGHTNAWYYRCFGSKTSESDGVINPTSLGPLAPAETNLGYGNFDQPYAFYPSDSDLALGYHNFGIIKVSNYIGHAWFSPSSTGGMGYLHVPIALLDATQALNINKKLSSAQFGLNKPTDPNYPLQNAGNTPIEGTLQTAEHYFLGSLNSASQGGPQAAPPNSCGKNFVVLLTDGLPSTASNGVDYADPNTAVTSAATAAAGLLVSDAGVETYIIGFGVNSTALNDIANAGGTSTAYSTTDMASLNTALGSIFSDILAKTGSAASVATNSTNLQTESRVFQAKFSSTDWSGQLLQYKLNDLNNPEWDAGSKINSQVANSRVIITKGSTGDGVPFRWSTTALTGDQQTYLQSSGVVDYLRGDATNEGIAAGNFRARTVSKLGDIVNSNPWYLGPAAAGYSDVDNPGYTAFRNGLLNRKPVVYVGANDGMLHGFDASLVFGTGHPAAGDPASTAGNEVLAYVPTAVYPNLSQLTGLTYNQGQHHQYFVDGSPMTADVHLGASWYTVLIGSLNGGGKGYYALDVTNPSNFSEANAADILLWEFTDSDDADVGFAYNYPPAQSNGQAKQIVKMANGKWAVILGNGYNSAAGKAVLYILFINDGLDGTWSSGDFVKITADASGNNGLSTPVPFDSDGDGYVDAVYAGDLKGNMWKFLVGPNAIDATVTSDPSTWKVAFSAAGCGTTICTPLFSATDSAGNAQPIIWPPEVTLHPDGGQVVLFGTGKYLESADKTTSGTQTFYSIHDDGTTAAGRSVLTPVSITIPNGSTYRTSATPANCGPATDPPCPNPSRGCYEDLPTSGERTTGVPKLDSGTVFFNTFIPTTTTCGSGGTGWLMAQDYLSCTTPSTKIFDTNNDGVINSSDVAVSGVQIGAALGGTTLIKSSTPGVAGAGVSSLVTGQLVTTNLNLGAGSRGRVSWWEIVQ